jgi:hypothetical protein
MTQCGWCGAGSVQTGEEIQKRPVTAVRGITPRTPAQVSSYFRSVVRRELLIQVFPQAD